MSEYLVSVESGYGEHESGLIYYVSQTEIGHHLSSCPIYTAICIDLYTCKELLTISLKLWMSDV